MLFSSYAFHFSFIYFSFLSGHLIKPNSSSFHHISFLSSHVFLYFSVVFPCICYLIASRQFKAGTQWELHVSSARVTGCTISFHLRAMPALSVYKMYGKTILMVSFSCVKWKTPQQNKQSALSSQGNWAGISKESKKWPVCVLFVSAGSWEEWFSAARAQQVRLPTTSALLCMSGIYCWIVTVLPWMSTDTIENDKAYSNA